MTRLPLDLEARDANRGLPETLPLDRALAHLDGILEHGLRHIPGASREEERRFNDGYAFGLYRARDLFERAEAVQEAPAPDGHVHRGEWCGPCVLQGRAYERSMTGDLSERAAAAAPPSPAEPPRPGTHFESWGGMPVSVPNDLGSAIRAEAHPPEGLDPAALREVLWEELRFVKGATDDVIDRIAARLPARGAEPR